MSLREELEKLIGRPYKESAVGPEEFDCVGLVRHCYRLAGIELPENLYETRGDFELVDGPARLMDVVVLRAGLLEKRHVGIMLDERWMLHCAGATNGVAKSEITRGFWRFRVSHMARHRLLRGEPESRLN